MEQIKVGQESFEIILARWTPLVEKFIWRFPVAHLTKDDVRQELHLILWRAWRGYDPSRGRAKFSTYLYTALWRRCVQLRVQGRPHLAVLSDVEVAPEGDLNGDALEVVELVARLGPLSPVAEGVARAIALGEEGEITAQVKQELRRAILGMVEVIDEA